MPDFDHNLPHRCLGNTGRYLLPRNTHCHFAGKLDFHSKDMRCKICRYTMSPLVVSEPVAMYLPVAVERGTSHGLAMIPIVSSKNARRRDQRHYNCHTRRLGKSCRLNTHIVFLTVTQAMSLPGFVVPLTAGRSMSARQIVAESAFADL